MISFPYISYHIMREIAMYNDDFCNYAIIVSIKQLGDVAMRFRLVAFADEAAPDLAGQIEAMQENGVELLEIRGVDGQNIDGISATKAKVIRKMLGFSGLAVWSLGSPFGKIGINDDFAPHLDSFKHSLELADILGAKHICLFSFYGTSDIDSVLERLNAFIEAGRQDRFARIFNLFRREWTCICVFLGWHMKSIRNIQTFGNHTAAMRSGWMCQEAVPLWEMGLRLLRISVAELSQS